MRLKAKPRLLAAPFRPQGGGHFPAAAARPPDTHTASQREKYGRSRFSLGEQRHDAVPCYTCVQETSLRVLRR